MALRLLIGLDPSEYSQAAVRMACGYARAAGGSVIGAAIVDVPGIERAEVEAVVGAGHFAARARTYHIEHATRVCEGLLAQFEAEARRAGVAHDGVLRRGRPAEVLATLSLGVDALVVGTRTFFKYETATQPGDALAELLRRRTCPVWAVPRDAVMPERVILPYDGSPEAGRAMRLLNYLSPGLPGTQRVLVVTVTDPPETGIQVIGPAVGYLRAYGHQVEGLVESGSPEDTVLRIAKDNQPGLVVLGISQKGLVSKLLYGSLTRKLLHDGTVPLFIVT